MSERTALRKRQQRTANRHCQHRWVIETPHGPRVRGYCKRCGETRSFPASLEGPFTFGRAASAATAQRKGRRG